MKRQLWIIHHYASAPNESGMSRPESFSKYVKEKGYEITVFVASFMHYSQVQKINDKKRFKIEDTGNARYIYVKTPHSSSTISRIFNMISFYRNTKKIAKQIAKSSEKPDVILTSSPHPLAIKAGIDLGKHFQVPVISEIRDLWPDAIFYYGKLKRKSLIGRLLTKGEYWLYKNSNAIIFLKEGDVEYIKENGWDKSSGGKIGLEDVFYINNGVDIKRFDVNKDNKPQGLDDFNPSFFNVTYVGAIRPVNDVLKIVKTAERLKKYDDIFFHIFGDGNQLQELKNLAFANNLRNIKFYGYLDKKFVPYVLNKTDVNLLNYSQSKYNWSRGSSSNKLFEYMAAGKPVISTVKTGYSLINRYNFGVELSDDTFEELAKAVLKIRKMYKDPDLKSNNYELFCRNARKAAYDYDYSILSEKLTDVINHVVKN